MLYYTVPRAGRLAKLTDGSWSKDLEIQNLRRLHASEESVSFVNMVNGRNKIE